MARPSIDLHIDELVVDNRLRMTKARLERSVIEEVHRFLEETGPEGLVRDANGAIRIESLTIQASNAMTPVRIGESIAGALSAPLGDPTHPLREAVPQKGKRP